jgi:hypothetical protein
MSNAGGMQRFYGKEGEYVTLEELLLWVRQHPLPDQRSVPVCIWSGRGQGKTAQVNAFCRKYGLEMITYHPAHDINGQNIVGEPIIDQESGTVKYAMPDYIPDVNSKSQGVWFIDEINRANNDVLAGLMEPLGEGTIAQSGWKIPDGWQIIVAANPTEVGYDVQELDEAMMDRMLHYNPGWEPAVWAKWAKSADINPDIIEFVLRKPSEITSSGELGSFELPKEVQDKMVASPRSMTYFASLYETSMPKNLLTVIGRGLIGREATASFSNLLNSPEKSLSVETILAEPITVDQNNQPLSSPIFLYDEKLYQWGQNLAEGDDLAQASVNNLIIYLSINKQMLTDFQTAIADSEVDQQSEDQPQTEVKTKQLTIEQQLEINRTAQLAGRFISRLTADQRNKAMETVQRIIPEWQPILSVASDRYLNFFAQQGQLISQPPKLNSLGTSPSLPATDQSNLLPSSSLDSFDDSQDHSEVDYLLDNTSLNQ